MIVILALLSTVLTKITPNITDPYFTQTGSALLVDQGDSPTLSVKKVFPTLVF